MTPTENIRLVKGEWTLVVDPESGTGLMSNRGEHFVEYLVSVTSPATDVCGHPMERRGSINFNLDDTAGLWVRGWQNSIMVVTKDIA